MIHFDIFSLEKELEELQSKTNEPDFWQDANLSTPILSKIKEIQNKINNFTRLQEELKNIKDMNELLIAEFDEDLVNELCISIKHIEDELEALELKTLLSEKYDKNNAILTLHPGAGGTESQDWVEMLYRMYSKWASSNNFNIKELDYLEGDEAGIKSVTFLISGEYAYRIFKRGDGCSQIS